MANGLLSSDNPYSCRDEIEKWLAWDTAWHRLALEVATRRQASSSALGASIPSQLPPGSDQAGPPPPAGPSDIPPTLPTTGSGVKPPTVTIRVPPGYKDAKEFLHDCQFEVADISTGDLFNALVGRLNLDGINPRSLSLGELEDAIEGATTKPYRT